MPKWIHDRAEHILARNPSMPKSEAFAIATQQAHAVGKSPKGYGTPQGRRTAKSKYKTPKDDKKVANPGGLESAKMAAMRDELVAMTKIGGPGEGDPIGAPQSLEQAWNERFRRHLDQKPLDEASPEFRIWQQEADNLMSAPGGPLFVGEVPPDLSSVREVDARLKALLATMPEDLNSPDAAPSINAARRYIESLGGPELAPPNPIVEPPQVEVLPATPSNRSGRLPINDIREGRAPPEVVRAYTDFMHGLETLRVNPPSPDYWKKRMEVNEEEIRKVIGNLFEDLPGGAASAPPPPPKVESPPRSWKHYAAGVAIPATIIGGAYGLYRLLKQPEPEEQEPQPTVAPPPHPQMQEVPPPPKPKKVVRPVSKRVPV